LAELYAKADRLVWEDNSNLAHRAELSQYGTGFCKTAALFFPARAGSFATFSLYALDQARGSESTSKQFLDFGLGALKGTLLRKAFSVLGSCELGAASKGVALGISSRIIEQTLTCPSMLHET
jgi:hypothetical protein